MSNNVRMTADNAIAIASIIATLAVAITGFILTRHQRQAESQAAITAILSDLTTGEVEHARNLVGTLRYGSFESDVPNESAVTRAYYKLTWALERTATASMAVERKNRKIMRDARTTQLQWHLDEIVRNVELLSAALILNDTEAVSRRKKVVDQLEALRSAHEVERRASSVASSPSAELARLKKVLIKLGIPVQVENIAEFE